MVATAEIFKVQVMFPHVFQIFLQRKSTCSNLETFKDNLIQRYGFLQWNPIKFEWYDTDGDKIRINDEEDWSLFMELNGKMKMLKDTDYDPRFWKATLNKYESRNVNEEEEKTRTDNMACSRTERSDGTAQRKQPATKKVSEEGNSSRSNETTKHYGVQSKEQEFDLPEERSTLWNGSRRRASIWPQRTQLVGEPSTTKDSVKSIEYVAEIKQADVIGSKQSDSSFPSLKKPNQNDVHSSNDVTDNNNDVYIPLTASSTTNVQKNVNSLNWNITEITKQKCQPTNYNSNAAPQWEYDTIFWESAAPAPAKNVYHHDPIINNSVLTMISMGYCNNGGWLVRLLESTNGHIDAALDVLYGKD